MVNSRRGSNIIAHLSFKKCPDFSFTHKLLMTVFISLKALTSCFLEELRPSSTQVYLYSEKQLKDIKTILTK